MTRPTPYLFLLLLLLSSCYKEVEGCLDARAVNFDVTADKNCCCTYPKLQFEVRHRYGKANLANDQAFIAASKDSFRIEKFNLLLSDVVLKAQNKSYQIADSTLIEGRYIKPDIVAISPDVFNYKIGNFPYAASFTKISFQLGIDDELDAISPTTWSSSSVLNNESLYDTSTSSYYGVVISLLGPNDQQIEIKIPNKTIRKSLSFDINMASRLRKDFTVELSIDYQEIFDGLDLENPSRAKAQIQNKLAQAVSVL